MLISLPWGKPGAQGGSGKQPTSATGERGQEAWRAIFMGCPLVPLKSDLIYAEASEEPQFCWGERDTLSTRKPDYKKDPWPVWGI